MLQITSILFPFGESLPQMLNAKSMNKPIPKFSHFRSITHDHPTSSQVGSNQETDTTYYVEQRKLIKPLRELATKGKREL